MGEVRRAGDGIRPRGNPRPFPQDFAVGKVCVLGRNREKGRADLRARLLNAKITGVP